MTIRDVIQKGTTLFKDSDLRDCSSPYLDSCVLTAFGLGLSREKLLAEMNTLVDREEEMQIACYFIRRAGGEPVAYITGKKEFYNLTFKVTQAVLVPRPETEILVEKALELSKCIVKPKVLDLCTGSGCIAVSYKHERSDAEVFASDISPDALEIACENANSLLSDNCIKFIKSDLFSHTFFEKMNNQFDMILTNPPYLTDDEAIGTNFQNSVTGDPLIALKGGVDGLDLIRVIIKKSIDMLKKDGYLLIEAGATQGLEVQKIMIEAGFKEVQILQDLAGLDRIIYGKL